MQQGGYLLLGLLAGLHPDVALARSLGRRARELLLAYPGLSACATPSARSAAAGRRTLGDPRCEPADG